MAVFKLKAMPTTSHSSIDAVKAELAATLAHAAELAKVIDYRSNALAKIEEEDLELAAYEKDLMNAIALKEHELKQLNYRLKCVKVRRNAIFNNYTIIKNGAPSL